MYMEMWLQEKSEEKRLERCEKKMARSIYGGIRTKDGQRRRTNKYLEALYNVPKRTAYIRALRITWYIKKDW